MQATTMMEIGAKSFKNMKYNQNLQQHSCELKCIFFLVMCHSYGVLLFLDIVISHVMHCLLLLPNYKSLRKPVFIAPSDRCPRKPTFASIEPSRTIAVVESGSRKPLLLLDDCVKKPMPNVEPHFIVMGVQKSNTHKHITSLPCPPLHPQTCDDLVNKCFYSHYCRFVALAFVKILVTHSKLNDYFVNVWFETVVYSDNRTKGIHKRGYPCLVIGE